MKKKYDPQLLKVLLMANSLNEILQMLKLICKNLNLNKVNSRTRHFKDLQFTFFGLIVKANGLMDRLAWQVSGLEMSTKKFSNISPELKEINKTLKYAHTKIEKNNVSESATQLIIAAEKFEKTFNKINTAIQGA